MIIVMPKSIVRGAAACGALLALGGCQSLIEAYVERKIEEGVAGIDGVEVPELPGGRVMDAKLGYGAEVAEHDVELGTPFRLEYTASNDATHMLWLDYELGFVHGRVIEDEFTRHDWWLLEGPFGVDGGPQWTLHFTGERSPVLESSTSITKDSHRNSVNGRGTASAKEFLAVLPAAAAGTKVVVTGSWTAEAGTTPQRLRLVVTD